MPPSRCIRGILAGTHLHAPPRGPALGLVERSAPLAGREQLTPAELSGYEVSLLNETAARDSLFNESVRDLFQGVEPPRFKSNREIYPPRLGAAPDYLGISVRLDYPDEVSRILLVPERTMPFEYVQRVETNRSAVRASLAFAQEHLPARVFAEGMDWA